jgi:DNA invertase Pin-like site-specific DNA recombinase
MATHPRPVRQRRDLHDLAGLRCGLYSRASQFTRRTPDKSVSDQDADGVHWAGANGVVIAGNYIDNDRSASRFAKRAREDFARLCADIAAEKLDIIWFFDVSRGAREMGVFIPLRDLCREKNVLMVVGGQVLDMRVPMHSQMLTNAAVHAESLPDQISEGVLRGIEGAARKGRPHGKVPFGYLRIYDRGTGEYLRQVPDEHGEWCDHPHQPCPRERLAIAADGTETQWTAAGIVRWIFAETLRGRSNEWIMRWLNDRAIPCSLKSRATDIGHQARAERWADAVWHASPLRFLRLNPAYIGRMIRGGVTREDAWEPLVSREDFYAVRNMLTDPDRRTWRPSSARYLLSIHGRCTSGHELVSNSVDGKLRYQCRVGCVGIGMSELDGYAVRQLLAWLSGPAARGLIEAAADQSAEVACARAEVERLTGELIAWQATLRDTTVKINPTSYAIREAELEAAIAATKDAAFGVDLPRPLRELIRAKDDLDALVRVWHGLDTPAKRTVFRAVARIEVSPVGRGRRNVPIESRVSITFGPPRA